MNIKDILKTVGAAALSTHPLGIAAIPIINKFLPDDKKLNESSTGLQAQQVITELSGTEKAEIELAEIKLEQTKEEGLTSRYTAMCKADGQQTRANIVNKAMNCLIGVSVLFMIAIAYVYSTEGAEVAFSYEMMAVFLAISSTFAYVVRAYFGDLRSETQSRHNAINGLPPIKKGLAGLIDSVKAKQ